MAAAVVVSHQRLYRYQKCCFSGGRLYDIVCKMLSLNLFLLRRGRRRRERREKITVR